MLPFSVFISVYIVPWKLTFVALRSLSKLCPTSIVSLWIILNNTACTSWIVVVTPWSDSSVTPLNLKNKTKMLCLNLHPWGFAHSKASGSKRFSSASFKLHQNSLNLASEIKVFLSSKPILAPVPLLSPIIQSPQNVGLWFSVIVQHWKGRTGSVSWAELKALEESSILFLLFTNWWLDALQRS